MSNLLEHAEIQYLDIMREILALGEDSDDRTGVGTRKLFGTRIVHDFENGFPLLTTKKMHTKSIIGELIWFLQGTPNAEYLIDNKITIWDEWMKDKSHSMLKDRSNPDLGETVHRWKELPETYGVQWRRFAGKEDWESVDQIKDALDQIKNNPSSRRILVTAWNPIKLKQTALPWCHVMFQFNCRKNDLLDISVYQRSADWFLGVPFNIASYSYLLAMFCAQTGRKPGRLIYNFGDSHIYKNHFAQCEEQVSRKPFNLPSLRLADRPSIDDYQLGDFQMIDYEYHPAIKAEVAV